MGVFLELDDPVVEVDLGDFFLGGFVFFVLISHQEEYTYLTI